MTTKPTRRLSGAAKTARRRTGREYSASAPTAPPALTDFTCTPSSRCHARVENRVQQIHQESGEYVTENRDEEDSLHQRDVLVEDRRDESLADSDPSEHRLRDNSTAQEQTDLQPDDG